MIKQRPQYTLPIIDAGTTRYKLWQKCMHGSTQRSTRTEPNANQVVQVSTNRMHVLRELLCT